MAMAFAACHVSLCGAGDLGRAVSSSFLVLLKVIFFIMALLKGLLGIICHFFLGFFSKSKCSFLFLLLQDVFSVVSWCSL